MIVFEKYEIAPGALGEIEFTIKQDTALDEAKIGTAEKKARQQDMRIILPLTAKQFAKKVKAAVGLPDVDVVETKEEFLELGAETVFTEELL